MTLKVTLLFETNSHTSQETQHKFNNIVQSQLSFLLRYSEIMVENRRFEPLFGASVGVIPLAFCRHLWHQKTTVIGYHMALFE